MASSTTPTTSPIVLGAMFFGTTVDEDTSFALLDRFVERGGVWIDTADCYSFWTSATGQGGDSEAVLGRWLASRPDARDQVRIAAYSPLLGGSYDNPAKQIPTEYDHPSTTRRLAALDEVAEKLGTGRSEVVFAWLLKQGIRPMLGGSKLDQLDLAMDAALMDLPDDALEHLDAV